MTIGLTPRSDLVPVRDLAAVALIDTVLARASRREFFTSDDAARLLLDVQASVHDAALGAAVASVVNDALVGYG